MDESLSTPTLPPAGRPRWRRWIIPIPLAALLAAGVYYAHSLRAADQELQEALAEADRLDPGWQLDDLEARRAEVPEAENAALPVLRAGDLLSKQFLRSFQPGDRSSGLWAPMPSIPPPQQLDKESVRQLREDLTSLQPARAIANRIADLPRGRFPASGERMSSREAYLKKIPVVAGLLARDAILRAHHHDSHGALRCCRGVINCGRSIGDESSEEWQLERMRCVVLACRTIERVLAQGQPGAHDLARAQRLVEQEDQAPYFLMSARGERAQFHRAQQAREEGTRVADDFDERVKVLTRLSAVKKQHARELHYQNQIIEYARLPLHERAQAIRDAEEAHKASRGERMVIWAGSFRRIDEDDRITHAYLRCTAVALAVERYRLAKDRWPDALTVLVPVELRQIPLDPYDGRPLRYRRLVDGVIVSTISPSGPDRGTQEAASSSQRVNAQEVRLWDVARRGQPSPAAAVLPPESGRSKDGK